MINKTFKELNTGEKFTLQKIVKDHRKGRPLTNDDRELYDKFITDWEAAEKSAKSRWPIIIGLIVISLLAVLKQCS